MRTITFLSLLSLFLLTPVWAEDQEEMPPQDPAPLLELHLNGATASIPHSDAAYRELAYVCEQSEVTACTDYVAQQVANFLNELIRRTKAVEREQACTAFLALEADKQEEFISALGGMNPCR
jgi:hypothetical protein